MSSIMRNLRESQRAPRRCTECARRRIRCSKTIPCDSCIRGRVAHKCTREVVLVRGTPVSGRDSNLPHQQDGELIRENSVLRERVARLEAVLQGQKHSDPNSVRSRANLGVTDQGDFEVFSTILEQWNLGAPEQESASKEPITPAVPEDLSATLSLLPARLDSRLLVRFSLETLGWIHCAVDTTAFLEETDAFESALESGQWTCLRNHGWLAVYLSVLTVSLIFVEESEVFSQLSPAFKKRHDLPLLPQLWYRATLHQLELCDFIGRPGLHTVQAIAVLNLSSRHLGERQREVTLTRIAINIAQTLKMHLLGSELSCPERVRRMPQWSVKSNREIGRRLWWSLVICDWLGAIGHPPSIAPDGFDCELSEGQYDAEHLLGLSTIDKTLTFSSPLMHHIAMAKLAPVVRSHVEKNDKSPEALYDTLLRLDELEQQLPFAVDDKLDKPAWALGQQCHYNFTLNLLRLRLSRMLFRSGMESFHRYEEIRSCALTAATAIAEMADFPHVYKKTWIYASATVSAGVFLALDLLKLRHSHDGVLVERQKHLIASCIAAIAPYADKTTICRGGSRILNQLLELISHCEKGGEQLNIMQLIIEMDMGSLVSAESPADWQEVWQQPPNAAPQNQVLFDERLLSGNWIYSDDWTLLGSDFVF